MSNDDRPLLPSITFTYLTRPGNPDHIECLAVGAITSRHLGNGATILLERLIATTKCDCDACSAAIDAARGALETLRRANMAPRMTFERTGRPC